jgi:uncharacterized protein (TIGR02466 family)
MSELYLMFPTPVVRVAATIENYDPVQLEIQAAYNQIQSTHDTSSVSYLYKSMEETDIFEKTYNFIEKYNCVNLKNRIHDAVNQYADKIGWTGNRDYVIKNSWINIADQHDVHSVHCHPGYAISGTYYFRVSKEQGSICFNNPNPAMMHCQFPQGALCPQTIDIIPNDGDIVLFPSWLMHSTRKNKSTEQRISVAFNVDFVGGHDIAYGLNKENYSPFHKVERSLRDISNIQ